MELAPTCPTNQWDARCFHWAVVNEVRSKRIIDMHDAVQVNVASREVMLTMLVMLIPAGNA